MLVVFVLIQSFSIALQPSISYANIPHGLGGAEKILYANTGIRLNYKFTDHNSMHISCYFTPRKYYDNVFLSINIYELYANYGFDFHFHTRNPSPYILLAIGIKQSFADIGGSDKTTFNIIGGHGYTISLSSHFYLQPEVIVYYQLTGIAKFHGLMVNIGIGYEF